MRGSPILSTITAILFMAGAYLWLHMTLNKPTARVDQPAHSHPDHKPISHTEGMISCYLEAHFSTPPSKFTISDPATGKILASQSNLTDNEWSDEIMLAQGESAVLNVHATWEQDSPNDSTRQNFILLILSPDQMGDSTATLRHHGEINTTAIFQLRK